MYFEICNTFDNHKTPQYMFLSDEHGKMLNNIHIMKKNKKQNIVAKYARQLVKAVTMRDRTKYSKKLKHKGDEECNY